VCGSLYSPYLEVGRQVSAEANWHAIVTFAVVRINNPEIAIKQLQSSKHDSLKKLREFESVLSRIRMEEKLGLYIHSSPLGEPPGFSANSSAKVKSLEQEEQKAKMKRKAEEIRKTVEFATQTVQSLTFRVETINQLIFLIEDEVKERTEHVN
jgi:hypothetical protein